MVRVGLDARAARDFFKDFDFLQPEISNFFSPTGVTGKYLDLLGFQLSNTWQVSWIPLSQLTPQITSKVPGEPTAESCASRPVLAVSTDGWHGPLKRF